MKKVLIFGVSGFVGPYLCQEFLNEGYVVCGSDIVKSDRLQKEVEFFQADLLDNKGVSDIIQNLQCGDTAIEMPQ